MPRNVRNFWITVNVDGRQTRIECGPASKDGGFSIGIQQRDNGRVADALLIEGHAMPDGTLRTRVMELEDTGKGHSTPETVSSIVSHRDKPSTEVPGAYNREGVRLIGVKYG